MIEPLASSAIYRIVNRYIGVSGGYLGDFSYRTHCEFYPEYCDLDIDSSGFEGTTRERFIAILSGAEPRVQARIVRGVVARFPVGQSGAPATRTDALKNELIGLAGELERTDVVEV